MGLIRFIYDVLILLVIVFVVPVWWFIYKRKGYNIGIKDRLFPKKIASATDAVWIHCASVGEIKTAMPIIEYISSKNQLFLTVFSPRAYKFAKENLDLPVSFLPFDLSFLIKKFIKLNRPKAVVLVEGELWFNLVGVSSENFPVISINSHIPRLRLYKPILNSVSQFVLKSHEDEERLKTLAVKSSTKVCGNLKILSKINEREILFYKTKKVILAGSTHHPEEEILIDLFKQIKKTDPDLMLIIAPRHIERVREVCQLAEENGFSCSLRTQTTSPHTDVYIIDTVGELSSFYKFADAVFVGGTLSNVGGHNIFEPILAGKKVIIGKHYHKIKELVEEAKRLNAIQIVDDRYQLKKAIELNLREPNIDKDVKKLQVDILDCYKQTLDRWL